MVYGSFLVAGKEGGRPSLGGRGGGGSAQGAEKEIQVGNGRGGGRAAVESVENRPSM